MVSSTIIVTKITPVDSKNDFDKVLNCQNDDFMQPSASKGSIILSNKHPGVYLEEIPSGSRKIKGVPTSITGFIGRAKKGLIDEPMRVTSFVEYERSLRQGLQWVIFEPNGESLWGQIRINLEEFMNILLRAEAFAGTKPNETYFVKSDHETTTYNHVNQGVVNLWVGFAPLKPAEFIVIKLQFKTDRKNNIACRNRT